MRKTMENQLVEKVSKDTYQNIEDFLGYPISADVLENLDGSIREVLDQMPEEEIIKYEQKYDIETYNVPTMKQLMCQKDAIIKRLELLFSDATNENYPFTSEFAESLTNAIIILQNIPPILGDERTMKELDYLEKFMAQSDWTDGNTSQQARAIFTTICLIGDINADTLECDNILRHLYQEAMLERINIDYTCFENFMLELIV